MPKIVDHDARRRELIEASWEVIAAEGLEGVTMRKIAKAADCTTGRITHYFADREALVLASLQTSNKATGYRVREIIASELNTLEKLRRSAEQTLPLDADRLLEWKVWIAFWSAATTDKALALENDARIREWFDAILPLVADVAPHRDAEQEANLLIGLINGVGLQAAVHPTKKNLTTAKKTIENHLDQFASNRSK